MSPYRVKMRSSTVMEPVKQYTYVSVRPTKNSPQTGGGGRGGRLEKKNLYRREGKGRRGSFGDDLHQDNLKTGMICTRMI